MVAEVETEVVRAQGFGLAEMVTALDDAGRRFVTLLRSLDPADGDRPVPGMTWTVAETAVHMLTIIRRGSGDRRRADSIEGLGELNDQSIEEIAERELAVVAATIESDMQAYVGLLRAAAPEQVSSRIVQLHAGVRADVPTALSYQLFDFLGHGMDIAKATERPWAITEEHAVLVLQASLPALRPWVLDDVLEGPSRLAAFTFPGWPSSLIVRTGQGTYDVQLSGREAAEAEVDPVEMFVAVAGRVLPDEPFIRRFATWYRPI